jgi:hypothetical protein
MKILMMVQAHTYYYYLVVSIKLYMHIYTYIFPCVAGTTIANFFPFICYFLLLNYVNTSRCIHSNVENA